MFIRGTTPNANSRFIKSGLYLSDTIQVNDTAVYKIHTNKFLEFSR